MIAYQDARYLKRAGLQIDVKITIRQWDGEMMIYIRDQEFHGFKAALRYLQRISEEEMVRPNSPNLEMLS